MLVASLVESHISVTSGSSERMGRHTRDSLARAHFVAPSAHVPLTSARPVLAGKQSYSRACCIISEKLRAA
eukprot:6030604-Prymnesium_polylepis.2